MMSKKLPYLMTGAILSLFVIWMGIETSFFRTPVSESSITGYAETGQDPLTISIDGPAPAFDTVTADGKIFSSDNTVGKPVVITFWASWCEACIESLAVFDQMATDGTAGNLVILTVNSGEDATTASKFLEELGLDLTILMDEDGAISTTFGQHYFPTTYFLDREGVIRAKVYGPLTEVRILAEIENLASYELDTTAP